MSLILSIETSTPNCSVALSKGAELLAYRESAEGNDHAAKTTVFIDEVLKEAGIQTQALDAVAVGKGPGSYTGLRIGVATAKGLAYALGKPLVAVSPLQAMAWKVAQTLGGNLEKDALVCTMTDAGRMEVYSAFYNAQLETVRDVQADIVDQDSYREFLQNATVYFAGNGAEKCKRVLESCKRAEFIDGIVPSACYMPVLAQRFFDAGKFEDVAYFEPFYLKDFIAGKPHVKGL